MSFRNVWLVYSHYIININILLKGKVTSTIKINCLSNVDLFLISKLLLKPPQELLPRPLLQHKLHGIQYNKFNCFSLYYKFKEIDESVSN